MDGPTGGGVDSRGGVWRGGSYDATNQIKQLLRIPTEEPGKSVVDAEPRTPPQNIPGHRQGQLINERFERSGSPSSRQQRWEHHRYHDGRHRVDSFGSPGRNNSKPGSYDQNRTPPQTYHDIKQRADSYGSPSRSNHRQGSYDRGYGGSPRNHHQIHQYQQHRGALKDHKDMRMNGPRHLNTPMNSQVALVSDSESPEFRPSPEVLAELEEQFLFPLKKKSIRFPKAKYFCRLCDYHCDSLLVCRRHISDARHRKLKEAKDVETTLKNVPSATDAHIAAIDKLIKSIAEQIKVTQEKTRQRREVVAELNDLLTAKVEGCRLEVVGSSVSGFCLETSDINIDVVMDDNLNPSTALLAVKELVGKNDLYRDVIDDLSSSFPTMSFTHDKTSLRMVVGANSTSSKYTNQLLADYASFDSRVPILGVAFRYWAQLCQIDDQSRGTLPPHVFPLMVVHFLQQHQPPVLPVLHQLHPNPDGDSYLHPAELGDKWRCSNTECVGKLWLDMFRFYTVGYKMTDFVINVRQLQRMTRAEKTWSKKIAIEDPFLQKRNLTRTVSGNPVFEYIVDRFKTTYKYFAIPQLSYGPLFFHIVVREAKAVSGSKNVSGSSQKSKKGDLLLESIEKAGQSISEGSSECEMERTEDDIDVAIEGEEDEEDEDPGNMSGFEADLSTISLEETVEEPNDSISPNGLSSQEEEVSIATLDDLTAPLPFVTPSQATKLMLQLQNDDMIFRFEGKTFTLGQKPPLICGSCQKEGHCKGDCREDELPPLKRLPPMNNHFLSQLTAIFEQLTKDFEPTIEEIEERDRIVADLEDYIRQFFRGATLKLFGSSANGFGFQRSDLDICLTFKGNPTGEDIDHIIVIESLAEKLKRYRQCGHVFAITTAKVPIVKFSIRRACLEGDLSLYNTLALQNTKLLYTYTKIDYRVKCLGYAMKYFAKLCDIGDASRGSLSSYAYILMVLHFLQQCRPPVIPVLQELYDHSEPAPKLIIDGWNAWFFDDIQALEHKWKDYGRNKESVGQLWVSMLRYYTETFNWKEHVVTIRQLAPLTRLQKLWNSRCIVIEDPFDLSHNLGAGLSRKMNTFIMKAFIRGREIFGTAVSGTPLGYRNLVDYLFDSKQLTDGAPPNDRGCRFCGKIGHVQKDCPKKRLTMERREKKERQKDRREMRKLVVEVEEREERQKEVADQKPAQESRENESREGVGGGPGGPAEPTGSGATPTPKSSEGILRLNIPLNMMDDHCEKWESNQEYRVNGDKILGMRRYSIESFDERKVGKGTLVCHCVPPQEDEKYVWTVNWNKAAQKVSEGSDISRHPFSSVYDLILKMVEVRMHYIQEPDQFNSTIAPVSTFDMPENIGQTLMEKIKEVADKRKQKKKERMKVRYRREMAGPGYKRGQKFEPGNKGSNDLGGKRCGQIDSQIPKDFLGKQEVKSIKKHNLQDCTNRNIIKNQSYMRANPDNLQIACSSSEDENFAQRTVRRKGKQKNPPDSVVHAGQMNLNISKDRNIQGNIGGIKKSKIYSDKEGAIKAKHQPSLGLTFKLVPVGPEKEIVTLSVSNSTCNQQNVVRSSPPVQQPEAARVKNPAEQEPKGRLSGSDLVVTIPRNGSEPRVVTVIEGAPNGAIGHKKRRKPRFRKGKKGGSKSEPDNEGKKSNRKNANVE
ncbi:terminal uridylyltransferase 7-like isoform X2 [Panulirus ornatus]|uniref:terminal uridylyltransferase 7-like isoform X2 n=1 Tax=Panulirus ornatus TaxID=150431 RepID=UPI003A879CEA